MDKRQERTACGLVVAGGAMLAVSGVAAVAVALPWIVAQISRAWHDLGPLLVIAILWTATGALCMIVGAMLYPRPIAYGYSPPAPPPKR